MKQIQLQKVSKRFGDVEVIPPLDLEIETGEFVVFVGRLAVVNPPCCALLPDWKMFQKARF